MSQAAKAIGVFDSGLGGLTVVRAIRERLPNEDLVYLGDTARVPYGTRSPSTVVRYARSCARLLAKRDIKLLVVACNTVSAVALDVLRVELDVPVMGVILPGARAGVAATKTNRVGVIATQGTVSSGAYVRAISTIDPRVEVFSRAAPLLVPLVEEGWITGDVPRLAVERYLEGVLDADVDTLVLGCTHYPVLRTIIEDAARRMRPNGACVVDSAQSTSLELASFLEERDLAKPDGAAARGTLTLLATDVPSKFAELAGRFLGDETHPVEQVDL